MVIMGLLSLNTNQIRYKQAYKLMNIDAKHSITIYNGDIWRNTYNKQYKVKNNKLLH